MKARGPSLDCRAEPGGLHPGGVVTAAEACGGGVEGAAVAPARGDPSRPAGGGPRGTAAAHQFAGHHPARLRGLITLGVLAGLGMQAVLLDQASFPVGRALVFSVLALIAGLAGGKAWYVAVHRGRRSDGWCIQGFITGAAAVAVAAPLAGLGIPPGAYLGAAAPGLLIGMAIGRPGCFWAGCCAGRPTASRWGIWSSDRRVGCRRVPAQLLEALLSLLIGLAALAAVLLAGLARSGPVAVAALAAYTLGRQFILRLRANPPRRAPRVGPVTATAAAVVVVVSAALLA